MKRLIMLAPLALLAACADDPAAPEAAPSATPSATPAAPTPSARASAAQAAQIPAAFVGLWDAEQGQCAQWSDAQLTVEPTHLQFYESSGEVTAVAQPDADTIIVTMTMSGEGETWKETSTYRLLDGGKVLEATFNQGGGGEPFRRKRCQAFVDVPMQ